MATDPRLPEKPERPYIVQRDPEWKESRPFPWGLIASIMVAAAVIALVWYFFR